VSVTAVINVGQLPPKQVFSMLLEPYLSECAMVSDETVREWIRTSVELVEELFERNIWVTRNRDKVPVIAGRLRGERLRVYFCDLYLSGYDMGTLPGFGMSNQFGDRINRNPERVSMRDI
jgi:hypothetical protein